MATLGGRLGSSGSLTMKKIKAHRPTLKWQFEQWRRRDRIKGLLQSGLAQAVSKFGGVTTMRGTLRAVHIDGATGQMTNYGIVSRRVITTAFITFMVDNLVAETSEWGDFKFHDSGVGTTGAAIGNTDIETTDGEARVTGTQVDADPIYTSVGTITYTSGLAITEHGLFSIVTGGTMLDRHTFGAINVVNTDSIQFTYDYTMDDGG